MRSALGLVSPLILSLFLASNAHARLAEGEPVMPDQIGRGSLLFRGSGGALYPALLLETEVAVRVTGMIARAEVVQRFRNPTRGWVEGVYVFPLPETAAVDGLAMRIGDRLVEGEIREREAARRTYEHALREGRKATLVSQERPNLFTTEVAHIGPGEEVEVVLSYQQDLDYDAGRFVLRVPLVAGPRFDPDPPEAPMVVGTTPAIEPVSLESRARARNPIRLVVEIDAGFALSRIESPYHAIRVEELAGPRYRVALADGAVPADRDFVLRWEPEIGHAPEAALFTQELDGELYALLMLLPPAAGADRVRRLPRETIFVIDTSGSMGGPSIEQARAALGLALDRLHPGDRFNVIQFNSSPEALFERSVPADRDLLERARRWVDGLSAGGGTMMLPALALALASPESATHVRQVVFITDGQVANESELFDYLNEHLGQSRLFPVGIGAAPNGHLMRRAAALGRGTFTQVGDIAEVGDAMGRLFAKLESPVWTSIEADWHAAFVEQWPERVPDLYAGEPVVLAVRLPRSGGELLLRGRAGDEPWAMRFPVEPQADADGIDKLWARRKIRGLMDGQQRGLDREAVREAVVELGLRHHLVSAHTSLVAVERTPSVPRNASLKRRRVAAPLPAGWGGVLPRTATPSGVWLLAGVLSLAAAAACAALRARRSA